MILYQALAALLAMIVGAALFAAGSILTAVIALAGLIAAPFARRAPRFAGCDAAEHCLLMQKPGGKVWCETCGRWRR